jgi:hypothetical protein
LRTFYLYAHAGLWKVEDFLYTAAIAVPRSIEMIIIIIIETLSLSGTPTRNVPRISIYFLPLELRDGGQGELGRCHELAQQCVQL